MNLNTVFAGDGRKKECIIEKMPRTIKPEGQFPFGTVEEIALDYDRLKVWADRGMSGVFSMIPGVFMVNTMNEQLPQYTVFVDPRYDTDWVIKEIEAKVQIGVPKTELSITPVPQDFMMQHLQSHKQLSDDMENLSKHLDEIHEIFTEYMKEDEDDDLPK